MYKDNRRTDKVTKIELIFSKLDFNMNIIQLNRLLLEMHARAGLL